MSKKMTHKVRGPYNYPLRVLSYLGDQKIATGKQIEEYCFYDASDGFGWRVIIQLRDAKLIATKNLQLPGERRRFGFSLTKSGLNELKDQSQIDLCELQTKSNTPYHDIVLNDLRTAFSRIHECQYFISENILRSKLLEKGIPDLAIFRSYKCDSAVLMSLTNGTFWVSVEYERTQKSIDRYVQRIKNWYQAENLPAILLVAESESLIQTLSEIDRKTLPQLKRKILYITKNNLLFAKEVVRFLNCERDPLTLTVSSEMKVHYPILDQNFAKTLSKS